MSEPLFNLEQFTTLVDGLDHPEGVAWGADGNWYAGGEAGQIYRIATDGAFTQVASTGGFVLGLALDGNHNIYACDLFQNKVFKASATGEVSVYSDGSADRKLSRRIIRYLPPMAISMSRVPAVSTRKTAAYL